MYIVKKGVTLIQVVIIEDNKYLREGWETFINHDARMEVARVFGSCEKAFESEALEDCDVVLLDINLPGMNGIEGMKIIRTKYPTIDVIMATVFDDDKYIFDALKAGAIGYLMKSVTPDELVAAIVEANSGGSPITPSIAKRIIKSLRPPKLDDESAELNERELQILKALATGKSYKEIGEEVFLSIDGVRHHIRSVYNKLEVNSRSEAVSVGLNKKIIKP